MTFLIVLVCVMLFGALLGLIFSRRGQEGEGALRGAKKAGGCMLFFIALLVLAVIALIIIVSVAV